MLQVRRRVAAYQKREVRCFTGASSRLSPNKGKYMKHALALVLATLAGAALATSAIAEPVVAKLQSPIPTAQKPVAGGSIFECLGDVCAARAPSSDTASLRGCKDLVRQVGAVTTFGPSSKPLSAEQLAECNKSAK